MVEAILPSEEERTPDANHRLLIRTSAAFGADCRELSKQLGCDLETVIGKVLKVGYESVKTLADGNDFAVVFLKDDKLAVKGLKNKEE